MRTSIIIGLVFALFSGIAIGVQATLISLLGRSIGPMRAGLFINFGGGALAGLTVLAIILSQQQGGIGPITRQTGVIALIAGGIGILVVAGLSYAYQQVGVLAVTGALIGGQVLIGIVVDTLGLAGGEPIPLDWRRITGLVVLAIATALILPRR